MCDVTVGSGKAVVACSIEIITARVCAEQEGVVVVTPFDDYLGFVDWGWAFWLVTMLTGKKPRGKQPFRNPTLHAINQCGRLQWKVMRRSKRGTRISLLLAPTNRLGWGLLLRSHIWLAR